MLLRCCRTAASLLTRVSERVTYKPEGFISRNKRTVIDTQRADVRNAKNRN